MWILFIAAALEFRDLKPEVIPNDFRTVTLPEESVKQKSETVLMCEYHSDPKKKTSPVTKATLILNEEDYKTCAKNRGTLAQRPAKRTVTPSSH